jgi:hypothetical protein
MKNVLSTPIRSIKLIPVANEEQRDDTGKLVHIKKPEKKSKILLPPQQERYVKAKEHDFL